ncbi:thiamine phosphate synthase [Georgenia sp. AZ-5]|uniref:thiamine phosphate synthase n=1 Tax=Georgenia sp. AZ-5 TaxID=3367526 RepID=UPI0037540B87
MTTTLPGRRAPACRPRLDLSLYLVTDTALCGEAGVPATVAAAVAAGVTTVQLRDPAATDAELVALGRAVRAALAGTGVPLLINDRADLVEAIGADGAHVGQGDMDVREAHRVQPHRPENRRPARPPTPGRRRPAACTRRSAAPPSTSGCSGTPQADKKRGPSEGLRRLGEEPQHLRGVGRPRFPRQGSSASRAPRRPGIAEPSPQSWSIWRPSVASQRE